MAAIVTIFLPLPAPEPRTSEGDDVSSRVVTEYLLLGCDVKYDISGDPPCMSIVRQVGLPLVDSGGGENGVISKVTKPWHDKSIRMDALGWFPDSFDVPGCLEVQTCSVR